MFFVLSLQYQVCVAEKCTVCESCGVDLGSDTLSTFCSECAELEQAEEATKEEILVVNCTENNTNIYNLKCEPTQEEIFANNNDSNDLNCDVSKPYSTNVHFESEKKPGKGGCTSCGGKLETTVMGCEKKLVCRDCGVVASSPAFDFVSSTGSGQENYSCTLPWENKKKEIPELPCFIASKLKIRYYMDKLDFPEEFEDQTVNFFTEAYRHKTFLFRSEIAKEHLAAVCLFVVARKNNIPLNLYHVAKHVPSRKKFFKIKRLLFETMDIHMGSSPSVAQHVAYVLEGKGFNGAFVQKVCDLLFLFRKAWLTEQRNRDGLVIFCARFIYMASTKQKRPIGFPTFVKKFGLAVVSRRTRHACNNFLLKLAQSLPWVDRSIKMSQVHHYLEDILQFQNGLMQLTYLDGDADKTVLSPLENRDADSVCEQVPVKELLLPPGMKRQRVEEERIEVRVPPDVDLDSPELKHFEFDEELSSYLFTEAEQLAVKAPKMESMVLRPKRER